MSKYSWAGLIIAVFFMASLGGQEASANASWKNLKGHAACSGVDSNGKLQEPCGWTAAEKLKDVDIKTACPKGTWFDGGTGSCWTCPKGFNRNANKLSGEKACDKPVPASLTKATFVKASTCPTGQVADGQNGGECWSCPSGYFRTAASIGDWNACGAIGKAATHAAFKGKLCSGDNEIWDANKGGECWSCPEGHERTWNPVYGKEACAQILDFSEAIQLESTTCKGAGQFLVVGTNHRPNACYSCPVNSKRDTSKAIESDEACKIEKLSWVPPKRTTYGTFGLGNGADEILAELIRDRTEIDTIIKKMAKATDKNEERALKVGWEVIDTAPWDSPYLNAALMERVIKVANMPVNQRSDAEKNLLATIEKLIQWDRQFIAQQAKQFYDNWVATGKLQQEILIKKMGAASPYMAAPIPPPDYDEMAAAALQATSMPMIAIGGALARASVSVVTKILFPFMNKVAATGSTAAAATAATTTGAATTGAATTGAATGTAAGGGAAAAGGASSAVAASVAGPALVAIGFAIIVSVEIDKYMAIEKAEGQIKQAIAISNKEVNLKLLLQKKEGETAFLGHWATVTAGDTKPTTNFKHHWEVAARAAQDEEMTAAIAAATEQDNGPMTSEEAADALAAQGPMCLDPTSTIPKMTPCPEEEVCVKIVGTTFRPADCDEPGARPPLSDAERQELAEANRAKTETYLAELEIANKPLTDTLNDGDFGKTKHAMRFMLRSKNDLCLTNARNSGAAPTFMLGDCDAQETLWFMPNADGFINFANDDFCVGANELNNNGRVSLDWCNKLQHSQWKFSNRGNMEMKRRTGQGSNFCLAVENRNLRIGETVSLARCFNGEPSQLWQKWED